MTIFERLFKRGVESGCMSLTSNNKAMWGWHFYIRNPTGKSERHECAKYSEGVRWLGKRARGLYAPKQVPREQRVKDHPQQPSPPLK
jgi:hypothetical protein